MVRVVVGDEGRVEGYVDSLFLSRSQVQVGLLVGKLEVSVSRDSVFDLVPTPSKDGEEAAKLTGGGSGGQKESIGKRNAKAKPGVDNSSVSLDTDWIAEHSRQVARMLVGGVDVVGIFVFAAEGALKNSTSVLWQAVRAVASASPLSGESDERLVLQISPSPRKISCRSCAPYAGFSPTALRPCDWKLGKLLSNLHTFTSSHSVEIRLPLLLNNGGAPSVQTVKNNLFAAISAESARLKSAVAVVDGSVPSHDKVLGPVKSLGDAQVVDYLVHLDGSGGTGDIQGRQDVAAVVTLTGVVHARAYASAREPLQRAITDLKNDIISSLRSRLDLLCDEAERAAEDAQSSDNKESENSAVKSSFLLQLLRPRADTGAECIVELPKRVFLPWHSGIFLCDYLLNGETLETDVKERCEELFAVSEDLDTSQILQPELSAVAPPASSFSALVSRTRPPSSAVSVTPKHSGKQDSPPHSLVLIGALVTLLIAMLLALFMLR